MTSPIRIVQLKYTESILQQPKSNLMALLSCHRTLAYCLFFYYFVGCLLSTILHTLPNPLYKAQVYTCVCVRIQIKFRFQSRKHRRFVHNSCWFDEFNNVHDVFQSMFDLIVITPQQDNNNNKNMNSISIKYSPVTNSSSEADSRRLFWPVAVKAFFINKLWRFQQLTLTQGHTLICDE